MGAGSGPLRTVVGAVVDANDRGVKINDAWYNKSRFAKTDIVLPGRGAYVALQVDPRDFLVSWTSLDDSPAPADLVDRALATTGPAAAGERETRICRLAVLKVAFGFAASREELKSADALALAEVLERWVLRAPE